MDKGDKKSALERAKEKLYRPGTENKNFKTDGFKKRRLEDIKSDWQDKVQPEKIEKTIHNKGPFFQKLLIISAIFFVVAVLIAVTLFFLGSNSISTENVIISVSGPALVDAGDEATFSVDILNRNNTTLKDAVLEIRFPDNTRNPTDLDKELVRIQEEIGDIREGQRVNRTIKSSFFGEEGDEKEVIISLEYGVEDSTAVFEIEKIYRLVISSAPLAIRVDGPPRARAGEEVEFNIEILSNSTTELENILLSASYPFGFEFTDSSPSPSFEDNVWNLGDIKPEEKKNIILKGVIEGQDLEDRIFRFSSGIEDAEEEGQIKTPLFQILHELQISKPDISLGLRINNKEGDNISVSSGERARLLLAWENNSPFAIQDARIEAILTGEALNKSSVDVRDGFYDSRNNAVRFDARDTESLDVIRPGDGGSVSFSFAPITFNGESSYPRNPTINIDVVIRGETQLEDGESGNIVENRLEREVKISSSIAVSSRLLRESGPFENRGPIPPVAEEETTYTVVWALSNTINVVSEVQVSAEVPEYIDVVGIVSPSDSNFFFDERSRTVVWNPDSLPVGLGYTRPPREVYFQIKFRPSLSQVDKSPQLLSKTIIRGIDSFTGASVAGSGNPLTTSFSTDPSFNQGDDKVSE